ncbi:helix-turn-helix domain-containing protein [Butyrivibrio sp. JL13D10]|uniref:helix-turn-helix domain-containing protein n=1 Tax=Butyrivibrio sp. JL13D10 TaxID=3236815 RepID=UPI0038B52B6F
MRIIHNPLGPNEADFYEKRVAERLGKRIRRIRESQNMTQASLGSLVDLTGDRIQKYENGVRKPKIDMLKKIAYALDVEPTALLDPDIETYFGVMRALFEMERDFNLQIQNEDGKITLSFEDDALHDMNEYLKEWDKEKQKIQAALNAAKSEDERATILHTYDLWKWNFPKDIAKETDDLLRERKKEKIKKKMEELQQELSDLDSEY